MHRDASHAPGALRNGEPVTVLVVEDEPTLNRVICSLLRRRGFVVLSAADGEAARAMLEGGAQVDILFSDFDLGGTTNGIDLAAWTRMNRPRVRIMLTSGSLSPSAFDQAILDAPLVRKPYSGFDVIEQIKGLLETGAQPPAPAVRAPPAASPR